MTEAARLRATTALFVVSGAAGLVDQVCFSRYLSYIVGSTAYAVSAVLAAFMAGMAMGAQLGGGAARVVRRPLVAYGALELVVAGAVAAAPWMFQALTPLYVELARKSPGSLAAVSLLRWGLAMAVVALPTMAMGATLPLLSRLVLAKDPAVAEARLGRLYAANTVGGALGGLAAAYVILPLLGLRATTLAAAGASGFVAIAAIALGLARIRANGAESEAPRDAGHVPPTPTVAEGSPAQDSPIPLSLWFVAILSGWVVFAAEVISTHLLVLVIGSSAYAFGLILAVFLGCLSLGAANAGRVAARFGALALPYSLAGAAVTIAVCIPLWDLLPLVFGLFGGWIHVFWGRELVRGLVAALILSPSVAAMGLTFPLLLSRVAARHDVARAVGRLTSLNTLGSVAGSLLTGYVVLPRLGSERSLWVIALAFAVAGVALARSAKKDSRQRVLAAAGAVALASVFVPHWNLARLTSGTNVYFAKYKPPGDVLFVREDVHGGVTTVTMKDGVHRLTTNGKFQGNDGNEMRAQRSFAHYPSLFVEHFDRALVIGLGTGTTLGTVSAYPWKDVDIVEISPSIILAADRYFQGPNRSSLHDPRVHLAVDDARNFLLVHDRKYDFVSMELTSVWFAGASAMYSTEFYDLVSERLADGGIFQQWIQLHHIQDEPLATVLHTLEAKFEHVMLFYGGEQGIVVASHRPLVASRARLARLEQAPRFGEVLPEGRHLADLLDDALLDTRGVADYIAGVASQSSRDLVSTDDNLYLEYETPKGNVLEWTERSGLTEKLRRFQSRERILASLAP